MIIGVGQERKEGCINIGTHDGAMIHCDEWVGVAILEIVYIDEKVYVVRTKDAKKLSSLDIVIDVGGGEFDHHMPGFNKCRPTGEKYASAGLVWKAYGEQAIVAVAKNEGLSISAEDVQNIKDEIDKEIIIPVDLEDNGDKNAKTHVFSFVSAFRPAYFEEKNNNEAFLDGEFIVRSILEKIIKDKVVRIYAKYELMERFETVSDDILEIPGQTMSWLEDVVAYNKSHNNKIKFIVFPYSTGGWAAQCVPPSVERKFEQLVPFPKAWAGGNKDTLPDICGIADATFCHNGRFFAKADTKESVVKMCKIAVEQFAEYK